MTQREAGFCAAWRKLVMGAPTAFKGADQLRHNLAAGIVEGMLATPWIFLVVPGNFVMAALLTQYFGLDKATYGWIVALPALANALQLAIAPWIARFLTPKDLAVSLGWFNLGLWVMLINTLGRLPREDSHGAAVFFGVFSLLSSLSTAFIGIGWTAWVRNWVPRMIQGRYFGNRNRWISFVTLAFLVLATALFAIAGHELWPYQVLCGIAVALRFGSLIRQNTIHADGDHRPGSDHRPWMTQLSDCLRAPGLLRFVLFSTWVGFWLAFTGPFLPVFCYEQLGVAPAEFSLFVILSTASAMAGSVFWGRLADRFGSIPILATGLFLWEVPGLFWAFVTKKTAWLLYPLWLWAGFVSVSYWLCSFNLLLNLLPKDARVAGSSLNLALTSAAATVAPVTAGFLIEQFLSHSAEAIVVYRVGFALKSAAILGGLFAIHGLREPGLSPRTAAPGAFATVRMILSGQGLGFLANLIPQRDRPAGHR